MQHIFFALILPRKVQYGCHIVANTDKIIFYDPEKYHQQCIFIGLQEEQAKKICN